MNSTKFIQHKKFLEKRYEEGNKIYGSNLPIPALVLVRYDEGVALLNVVSKTKTALNCAVIDEDKNYNDGITLPLTTELVAI